VWHKSFKADKPEETLDYGMYFMKGPNNICAKSASQGTWCLHQLVDNKLIFTHPEGERSVGELQPNGDINWDSGHS